MDTPTNGEIASDHHLFVTYYAPNSVLTEDEFEKRNMDDFLHTMKDLHQTRCDEQCYCGDDLVE